MSLPRITEILENELITGWTAELITATGAETVTVKATAGKVARIKVVDAVITVTPINGSNAMWAALTNAAELDLTGLTGTPMAFDTSIKLTFSAAGTAWILYK
jgi:hypothetical protein